MAQLILAGSGQHHVPIRVWARTLPDGALDQLRRIASQPYVVEHVAAMPDVHVAHGVAVGTVFATERVVVPAALGGDLGCGMAAVRFDHPAASLSIRDRQRLLEQLGARIPVGDAVHRRRDVVLPEGLREPQLSTNTLRHAAERLVTRHLGTLGGGNHFVELDRDGGGDLWLLVHSGSRGLGSAIAAHHLRSAEERGIGELPGLDVETPAGRACLDDLAWALAVARANRDALLAVATETICEATGAIVDQGSRIDVHHNFVAEEEHFGRRLWVHRKGAIAASAGPRALIPGSMGTASYIVEGLGDSESFRSGSHGAGRTLTRKQARQRVALIGQGFMPAQDFHVLAAPRTELTSPWFPLDGPAVETPFWNPFPWSTARRLPPPR